MLTLNSIFVSYSDSAYVKINNLQWHFVCTTWNGDARLVKFYVDGKPLGEAIQFGAMNTSLYLEGNFTIGVDSTLADNVTYFGFVGMMSQLNIWKVFLNDDWFRVMSAGGVNVNGNILAWRSVINGIIGTVNVIENSDIFLPGKEQYKADFFLSPRYLDTFVYEALYNIRLRVVSIGYTRSRLRLIYLIQFYGQYSYCEYSIKKTNI